MSFLINYKIHSLVFIALLEKIVNSIFHNSRSIGLYLLYSLNYINNDVPSVLLYITLGRKTMYCLTTHAQTVPSAWCLVFVVSIIICLINNE